MNPADDDALREKLRLADTPDRELLSRLWYAIGPRFHGSEILPLLAAAFETARHGLARACNVHHATLFARADDRAIELGLRALADPIKEVRARACMLLAHGRKREAVPALRAVKAGPTRELARRAAASIAEGERFAADGDPLYFFFRNDTGRAPRGSFADEVEQEVGPWLVKRGYRPSFLFAHAFAFRRDDVTVGADWDGYDIEAHVSGVRRGQESSDELVRGGQGDIAEIGRRIRARVLALRHNGRSR